MTWRQWLARAGSGLAVAAGAVLYMTFVVPQDGLIDLRESVLGLTFFFGGSGYAIAATGRFVVDSWRRRWGGFWEPFRRLGEWVLRMVPRRRKRGAGKATGDAGDRGEAR